MKYIKLFEDHDNLVTKISFVDYREWLSNHLAIDITNEDLVMIRGMLGEDLLSDPILKLELKSFKNPWYNRQGVVGDMIVNLIIGTYNKNIYVFKYDDEWFSINYELEYDNYNYHIIDSYEGLEKYFKELWHL
jgi:hypothetical protein